uniref:Uncharacterized protein n=1 Tax=Knipowitschia caucasica TaxID=637954 RepID=A0AAV2KFD2_KNICA
MGPALPFSWTCPCVGVMGAGPGEAWVPLRWLVPRSDRLAGPRIGRREKMAWEKQSDPGRRWQLCYDLSARSWWMVGRSLPVFIFIFVLDEI